MKFIPYAASVPSSAHLKENQDAFFVDIKNKTAGVFDGVGGLSHGAKAAASATEFCKGEIAQIGIEKTLESCHVFLKEKVGKELGADVATTASLVQIYSKQTPALVIWGNVGDSRVYCFSEGSLAQESVDDSLITQAQERGWISREKAERINQATNLKGLNKVERNLFNGRNMITQAVGIGIMKPRIGKFQVKVADLLVLTSDGVHDNLTSVQMEEILKQKPVDPAKKLVEEAIFVSESGSIRAKNDDMTAVVLEFT